MKIGLLGYGYTASFFAQYLLDAGHTVWGTSRNPTSPRHVVPHGVDILEFSETALLKELPSTTGLLISIPPNADGIDPAFELLQQSGFHKKYRWIVYLSSTGVYGDHQGQWVDETSDCHPETTRAQNRLLAEKNWLSFHDAFQLPVMSFRLSGIYGPQRNAIERLRAGKESTVFKPGQYFSRIHVCDIAEALFQSFLSPMPGEIFNLSDDHPCGAHEVDEFAAELLKIEKPERIPYENATLSPMGKEFYQSNRRVCNDKLKKFLLPALKFPSYQEGLNDILSRGNAL